MDLPEDKGTYVLIASVAQMKRLEIGSLGAFDIVPGFYAYVVSGGKQRSGAWVLGFADLSACECWQFI
jgi:Uri superfamily endonuclease